MGMRRCTHCAAVVAPAAIVCPSCLGREFEPTEVPASGRLVSWTTIRRAPAGYPAEGPYEVVIVDLAPGLRVTGRLAQGSPPPRIDAVVQRVGEEGSCPIFSLAQE